MLQQAVHPAVLLALVSLLSPTGLVTCGQKGPDSALEEAAHDALVKFDKNWKDYTNEPNYGDPRWKLKMEALVRLAKSGSGAIPVLEAAAKEGSLWAPHTRAFASYVLKTWREIGAVPNAWASYDLSKMDSAKVGKVAPDFMLVDAVGQSYRLSEYRSRKTIVLTFIIQDT